MGAPVLLAGAAVVAAYVAASAREHAWILHTGQADPGAWRGWWVLVGGSALVAVLAALQLVATGGALRAQEAAAELQRSNAELEQFAHVASHDLREPLRMVASYCQLLDERYRDRLDARGLQLLDFAVDGARRMQRLIDDLLDYSRVGGATRPFEPVACNDLVDRVCGDLGAAIREADAAVTRDDLPMVRGDPEQLERLFANLLGNAVRFRGTAPPRVHVSGGPAAAGWEFAVADNGIGIPPEHAERVFQMFQRLHARDAYPGDGIGLAIAKRIVERHGGRIWVEPGSAGGSVFRFTLAPSEREEG